MSTGRSAFDIVQAGAGGEYHRALGLEEAQGTLEFLVGEFEYDEGEAAKRLVELAQPLLDLLPLLSVTEGAVLTLKRECGRCSGGTGEPGCIECGGCGYVHADEADG